MSVCLCVCLCVCVYVSIDGTGEPLLVAAQRSVAQSLRMGCRRCLGRRRWQFHVSLRALDGLIGRRSGHEAAADEQLVPQHDYAALALLQGQVEPQCRQVDEAL